MHYLTFSKPSTRAIAISRGHKPTGKREQVFEPRRGDRIIVITVPPLRGSNFGSVPIRGLTPTTNNYRPCGVKNQSFFY